MDAARIVEVVNILIVDPNIIKHWSKLKDRLGLNKTGSFAPVELQYKNGTLTVYELFHTIISEWVSTEGNKATIENLSSALDDLNFQQLKEKIQTAFPNEIFSQNSNNFNNVDPPVLNFIGRNKELENLNLFYKDPKTSIVRVIGMGGVGKSELIKTFAKSKSKNTDIIWLNGESSNLLRNSLILIGKGFGVNPIENNNPKSSTEIFKTIISKFPNRNDFRCIVLIDNVDIENTDVNPLTRQALTTNCFVIVTSRQIRVLTVAGKILNLDVLDDEDCYALIRQSISEQNEDDIRELCRLLHNLPLALQQAIGFIKEQQEIGLDSYLIEDYLNEYEKQKEKMLDFPLNSVEHIYAQTTYVTWNISVDKIKTLGATGAQAVELLQMMSYFRADGIRVELILSMRQSNKNESSETIKNALQLLKQYSLIRCDKNIIAIHRLVQEVTQLASSNMNEDFVLLHNYVNFASEIVDELPKPDIIHIVSLWRFACKHTTLIVEYSDFAYTMSIQLQNVSLYNEMEGFSRENYALLENVLGISALQTLEMEENWAESMKWNGKYSESLEKYKVLVPKCKTILGGEHELTLTAVHNMASVLDNLERYEEALSLYKELLELQKKVFGENSERTMSTKQGVAGVLSSKGEIGEAMRMYAELLEWQRTNSEAEHPTTLASIHNLAYCHSQLEEYEKAKEMFASNLKTRIKVLGEEHSETLSSKKELGITLCALGEFEEGLRMLSQVLVSQEKVLGAQHPDTIGTRNTINSVREIKNEVENSTPST